MKPLTQEALRRRAMAMGAKLEVNGHTFNAGRAVAAVKIPAPPPEIEEVEEEDQAIKAIQNVAHATLAMCEVSVAIVDHLKQQFEKEKPKSPRKWLFTMVRDGKGNLVSVEATAKE